MLFLSKRQKDCWNNFFISYRISECAANNFAKKTECFKCGEERPEGVGGGSGGGGGGREARAGDWTCPDEWVYYFQKGLWIFFTGV